MTEEESEYYSRQIVLPSIGYEGQKRLKGAKIAIMGLGGLGSPAAIQLASVGIGHLRLVDRDVVELSNLHRQHLYDMASLGLPKVEAAAKRLRGLNPNVAVEPLPFNIDSTTVLNLIEGMDAVVDGLDSIAPRYAINRACMELDIPYVFAAAIRDYGNTTTIMPGEGPCLECFQGNLRDESMPSCGVAGINPSILGILASIQVSETVKVVLGESPRLPGKLLHCNIQTMTFEEIDIVRVEGCPVCGDRPSGPPFALASEKVEEVCGRGGRSVYIVHPEEMMAVDLDGVQSLLRARGWRPVVGGELGFTMSRGESRVSVLESGVMVIEGAEDQGEALSLHEEVVK